VQNNKGKDQDFSKLRDLSEEILANDPEKIRTLYLSIQKPLLWNHALHDVLDLYSGVLGLLCVRVRGHDALVTIDSFMQVLCRVVRRICPCVLLASLCKFGLVSHIFFSKSL
jgi:hypothetical protein